MDSTTPGLDQYLNAPPETIPEQPAPAPETSDAPTPDDRPINVINPSGKLVSVPHSQIQEMDLLNNGYREATPDELHSALNEEKYGGTRSQIETALRGAGSAATFGAFPLIERGLTALEGTVGLGTPYDSETIAHQSEQNPYSNVAGQAAGLFTGPLGLLGKVSDALVGPAAAKIAPYVPKFAAKIGSAAAKAAIENGLFQSGQEVDKLFAGDPNQTADTALSNIKYSALFGAGAGAAFGTVPELWKAASKGKTGQFLQALTDKFSGSASVAPDVINEAIQKTGMTVAPEIKAALDGTPEMRGALQTLLNSPTGSGAEAKAALSSFTKSAGDSAVAALQRTPEHVQGLADLSEADAGKALGSSIANSIEKDYEPIAKKYKDVEAVTKNAALPQDVVTPVQTEATLKNPYLPAEFIEQTTPGAMNELSSQVAQKADQSGWLKDPDSPQSKFVTRVIKALPNNESLLDFQNYAKQVKSEAYNDFTLRGAGVYSGLKDLFSQAEDTISNRILQDTAPEMLQTHADAITGHKAMMDVIDPIHDRLPMGSWKGVGSFVKDLREMVNTDPETILKRLSGKNDSSILTHLSDTMPDAAGTIRNYHIDSVLKKASQTVSKEAGQVINPKVLLTSIEKMTPEMRQFSIAPEALERIKGIQTLLDGLPKNANPSGTASMLSKLQNFVPASLVTAISFLTGHNLEASLLMGGATKYLSTNLPDAIRLAMLKFMGSDAPIQSEAFKVMMDYAGHLIKGEGAASTAVKNVFKSGRMVLPEVLMPKEKDRKKLDQTLSDIAADPSKLLKAGGQLGYYMPEHSTVLSQKAASGANYLNSLRPQNAQKNPLDPKVEPSKIAESKYHAALDIAEQPLSVLQKMKEGLLTSQDMQHMHALYPNLVSRLQQKLTNELIELAHREEEVSPKMRRSLSLFMGQDLYSDLSPSSMQMTQATFQLPGNAQQPPSTRSNKVPAKSLEKIGSLDQTVLQSRAGARSAS